MRFSSGLIHERIIVTINYETGWNLPHSGRPRPRRSAYLKMIQGGAGHSGPVTRRALLSAGESFHV
jgi:hypothetical protein